MKIAVYAIALNEQQFVKRWAESAKDADYLLIADTGSTDGTVEEAIANGVNVTKVSIKPWRFDDARNASLAAIPDDIDFCIALDMDEVLVPGWREELEKVAKGTTRPRYKYTWSWGADGSPGLQYGGDKIHSRHGYRWKHPVHEVITLDRIKEVQEWVGLEIHHYPDHSKSRGQYFHLLELSTKEDPTDDRNAFYLAREYFYYKRYPEAIAEFKRYLSLPKAKWSAERAAAMRFLAKCEPENALLWLKQACKEDPSRRESLVELSSCYYEAQDFQNCYWAAIDALAVKEKPLDYLCEEFAWGALPYDLAAISAYKLGFFDVALEMGEKAATLNPSDARLVANLNFYKKS